MARNNIYLTTTLPYVNADPHIGFAAELVHADIVARFQALSGREVFFNTGTDEHGLKIYRNAQAAGQSPQEYVDGYAAQFRGLREALGIWEGVNFIRTTDPAHIAAAQEFWWRCAAAGDIYKKTYQIKYCVGCELEKTDSELVEGKCLIHPSLELEIIDEENYFFRFSRYQKPLLELYREQPDFVVPNFRFNEIKSFVERGLEDFSISRLASKMPWGVPVPDDPGQVMYVWFDALVNYVSAIGWPGDETKFKQWWPVIQFAGKDNLRQQAAMWQAMLMSAGLPPSRQIIIRGFVAGDGGQKMSKSLGNVINPYDVVQEFGTEALRLFVARHISQFEDTPVTPGRIKEAYNADLANGLGNLVSRLMRMATTYEVRAAVPEFEAGRDLAPIAGALENYDINRAAEVVWSKIADMDGRIQQSAPFKLIKTDPRQAKQIVASLLGDLVSVAFMLKPLMPNASEKILTAVREHQMPEPLFLRKE